MRKIGLLVLALAAAGQSPSLSAKSASAPKRQISISMFAFAPEKIEVQVGDVVEWTNADLVPHTATADDGAWTTGDIKHGAAAQFTPTAPGAFAYHCRFHPQMKGVIVVTSRPASQ